MLVIPAEIYRHICLHGIAAYPLEGCGVLVGTRNLEHNTVSAIQTMQNIWPVERERSYRFRIDTRSWVRLEMQIMDQPLDIIGIFHTHPDSPPIASAHDLEWAAWPGYSYLITTIIEGAAGESRSWALSSDRSHFIEEPFEIAE